MDNTGSIIIIDSSDDEAGHTKPKEKPQSSVITTKKKNKRNDEYQANALKRKLTESVNKVIKRIKPTRIGNIEKAVLNDDFNIAGSTLLSDIKVEEIQLQIGDYYQNIYNVSKNESSQLKLTDSTEKRSTEIIDEISKDNDNKSVAIENEKNHENDKKLTKMKTELNDDYKKLIESCRKADPSTDMEMIIQRRILRYYEDVHSEFVNSKSFCKIVRQVTDEIEKVPELVYIKLKRVLDELKSRKENNLINNNLQIDKNASTNGDGVTNTSEVIDRKREYQIRKLNRALCVLQKKIIELDNTIVNFDDELNSSYIQSERCKKRAWEIYDKICDMTGESKHAQRNLRKPIHFRGTSYTEFNHTIQNFVNRTKIFPDFYDVLQCLELCNKQYHYNLTVLEMKKFAQDAFIKIGKLLQNRRRADLYETASYFVGSEKDPADEDQLLQTKLSHNSKLKSRINDIIDKFATEQEHGPEEESNDIEVKKIRDEMDKNGVDNEKKLDKLLKKKEKIDFIDMIIDDHVNGDGSIIIDESSDDDDDDDNYNGKSMKHESPVINTENMNKLKNLINTDSDLIAMNPIPINEVITDTAKIPMTIIPSLITNEDFNRSIEEELDKISLETAINSIINLDNNNHNGLTSATQWNPDECINHSTDILSNYNNTNDNEIILTTQDDFEKSYVTAFYNVNVSDDEY